MSVFTLYHGHRGGRPARQQVLDLLAGNLCRCTGYRPIADAAIKACSGIAADRWTANAGQSARVLESLNDGNDVFVGSDASFVAKPVTARSLADLAARHPDATIVSGATDVGLWITKQLRVLPKIILTGGVSGLHEVTDGGDRFVIGAAATYAEAGEALSSLDDDVREVLRRLGSAHVRASGTVGGNIANGSPIGDMPPLLMALGATLHLRHGDTTRQMPLEDFFVAYGQQDRRPGELVWQIEVPKLKAGEAFRAFKISKRFDQDISAVMAAFKFGIDGRRINAARIAFGGMAATPKRAAAAEAALIGATLDHEASWDEAVAALTRDYQPIGDMRATASYRMGVAQGLLKKALLEMAGVEETRVVGKRRAVV
jgi:xanthine dehydrogenase small subunit